jgi:hypothetical protein
MRRVFDAFVPAFGPFGSTVRKMTSVAVARSTPFGASGVGLARLRMSRAMASTRWRAWAIASARSMFSDDRVWNMSHVVNVAPKTTSMSTIEIISSMSVKPCWPRVLIG